MEQMDPMLYKMCHVNYLFDSPFGCFCLDYLYDIFLKVICTVEKFHLSLYAYKIAFDVVLKKQT